MFRNSNICNIATGRRSFRGPCFSLRFENMQNDTSISRENYSTYRHRLILSFPNKLCYQQTILGSKFPKSYEERGEKTNDSPRPRSHSYRATKKKTSKGRREEVGTSLGRFSASLLGIEFNGWRRREINPVLSSFFQGLRIHPGFQDFKRTCLKLSLPKKYPFRIKFQYLPR